MKGLLVKDFLLMIKSKKVILFMLFIGIIGGINDISFATGYILMVLAILSLSTISYDEANHGLKTLFTLPISKSDYVKEKYLFSLIITGIGFVFVTILGYFSKSDFMETLAILSTALFLLAISLPFQLKEGNEKGRIVLFVVVFGCTFLFAFLNQFFSEFFESMEETLNALDPTMFSVGLLITSIILYIISMMISIRIYNKKIVD
ncbi:ABC-2 transporter permease [Holdemanella biformis]|uniref:ABC-2 transporter permease n=1 Tax=Holdemanella biformis TaxID=1735 RepID=A0A413CQR9_9FIRM|nr:ABC-2 transporter permease [Holdemanella biformis]RGW72315.1 ABC-2 transporter permease [Holdemanella biformis]